MKRWILLCALVAAPVAAQQEPVPEPDVGGPGVRSTTPSVGRALGPGLALSQDGDARLHLSLDAAVGFDSNPYSIPLEVGDFAGDGLLRLRPGLDLRNPGALLSFNSWAYFDWGLQAGVVDPATRDFFLYQGGGAANLEVNRGGMFTFAVGDTLTWNRDPGVVAIGTIFNRLNNNLKLGTGFRPGGGTISARLLYDFVFEKWFDFEGTASPLIRGGALDQMAHYGTLRLDWRFLPRTGAFLNVRGGVHTYPFDDTNPTSFPLDASIGLMGQFTPKLSGLVRAGYGNTFVVDEVGIDGEFDEPQVTTLSLLGLIGQAEMRYAATDRLQISGGYQRAFSPAPLYQFVGNNRFYLAYQQLLGAQLQVSVRGGFSILEFGVEQLDPDSGATTQPVGRLDTHLDLNAQLSYFLTKWFSVGIANDLDWRLTNAADATDPANPINFSYVRNETLVIASLHY